MFGYTLTGLVVFLLCTTLIFLFPRRMSIVIGNQRRVSSAGCEKFLKQRGFENGGKPSTQLSLTLENWGKVETESAITGSVLGYHALIYTAHLTWKPQGETVTSGEVQKGDSSTSRT